MMNSVNGYPIERHGTATVIDTPEGIARFHALQLYYALKIEVDTGMSLSRGSVLAQVNKEYDTNHRTKAKALEFMAGVVGK